MDWYLAAPFIYDANDLWLTSFVPEATGRFHAVPATYQHNRSRRLTGLRGWADYFQHGARVWRAARQAAVPSGILTCFPQLPLTIGLQKRLARSDIPIVAWTFNVGTLYGGARLKLAKAGFVAVDRFIVHSRAEIKTCSEWLNLPAERFQFVPLQRAVPELEGAEDRRHPFILSMGSAHRDYRLLFAVLAELGLPAVVVTGAHAVQGLTVPPNVELKLGLSEDQCHALLQRARLNVIPVANQTTASGQVTLLDAMMSARPAIVTSCPASVDYVVDGVDAMLVRHGDHDQLKAAIQRLWDDETLRASMGAAARKAAIDKFSDDAIGRAMGTVLRDVAAAQ